MFNQKHFLLIIYYQTPGTNGAFIYANVIQHCAHEVLSKLKIPTVQMWAYNWIASLYKTEHAKLNTFVHNAQMSRFSVL